MLAAAPPERDKFAAAGVGHPSDRGGELGRADAVARLAVPIERTHRQHLGQFFHDKVEAAAGVRRLHMAAIVLAGEHLAKGVLRWSGLRSWRP